MSCSKATPFLLRASASGANVIGSIIALFTQEKPNPFFYLALYASSVYFVSNVYEGIQACRTPVTRQQLAELETIRIESHSDSITMERRLSASTPSPRAL